MRRAEETSAAILNVTAAVRTAVHRLLRWYADLIPDELEGEIRFLLAAVERE